MKEDIKKAEFCLVDGRVSVVRSNLLNERGYSPYCGNRIYRLLPGGCDNPRMHFDGSQFVCPRCGHRTEYPSDFIDYYKKIWNIT